MLERFAAALGQMVAGLSRKKKSQAGFVDQLSTALDEMRRIADELAEAIDRDAASYDAVMAAFKLSQGDAQETQQREEAIQKATKGASEVPLQVAERSVELLRTAWTTACHHRGIHEIRLASGTAHGRGRRARSDGERGDQSERADGTRRTSRPCGRKSRSCRCGWATRRGATTA